MLEVSSKKPKSLVGFCCNCVDMDTPVKTGSTDFQSRLDLLIFSQDWIY